MKRFIVLLLALCGLSLPAHALEVPPLSGRVVDHAGILDPAAEQRISGLLEAHEKKSGQQFAVLTVPTLGGDALEDFSMRVVDAWKLGAKDRDDGLLLLVVPEDRKVRIEVGYGLEGDITDALSSRVIRNVIGPAFRRGDYAGGIEQGLAVLIRAATGEEPGIPAEPAGSEPARGADSSLLFVLVFFFLPLLLPALLGSGRGRHRRGGVFFLGSGGGFGGGGFGRGGGGFGGGGGGFGGGGASGSW